MSATWMQGKFNGDGRQDLPKGAQLGSGANLVEKKFDWIYLLCCVKMVHLRGVNRNSTSNNNSKLYYGSNCRRTEMLMFIKLSSGANI